ncbi:MAG: prolyl oligopeptidase family serine peptidase [Chitinophagaceae bacterium]|nr:prolyl oligopeptidase family serine peptidase [Chitinophagaceae bacterium]MCW5928928.1 prolyl oligopeptidase family serine peptidase [Chitinophagaceae bacterium]
MKKLVLLSVLCCNTAFGQHDNIWNDIRQYFTVPDSLQNDFGGYRSPLLFNNGAPVKTKKDWQRRKKEILTDWETYLGKWPAPMKSQSFHYIDSIIHNDHIQYTVEFSWTPNEKTTAYLLVPRTPGIKAAVVTVFYEPGTAIGEGRPNRDFAIQLVKRGFITLSLGTKEASQRNEFSLYYPSIDSATVQPLSMLAYAANNAFYVLANRKDTDSKRIGIAGHSFGGKWAMFASCLTGNFAAAAWSDPGIVMQEDRESINYWEPWYLGYHPKPWRSRGLITESNPAFGVYNRLRKENRNLHELHALMAPRPFLVSGGSEDPVTRWKALNHSIEVNSILGFRNRVAMTNRPTHDPTPESNEVMYKFFEYFLRP